MNKFAERLKELMKIRNLTQKALGERLNVAQKTVSRWCSGQREPSFDMLLLLCAELNEEPNYILGFED